MVHFCWFYACFQGSYAETPSEKSSINTNNTKTEEEAMKAATEGGFHLSGG